MQANTTRRIAKCPNCDADASYRTWENVNGTHGSLHITSDAHRFLGSKVKALVCKQCGYIQMFINPQDFYKGGQK